MGVTGTAARVIFAMSALIISGCGSQEAGSSGAAEDTETEYSVETSADDAKVTMSGKDGARIDIDAGPDVAAALPEGFSLYPGARAVSSTQMQQADGSGVLVVLESADTPAALVRFYRDQAEAAGIVIDTEMASAGSTMIQGESADGRIFSFNASRSADTAIGQLLIGRDER